MFVLVDVSEYWSDSGRSVSSGPGTPTGQEELRYLSLDQVPQGYEPFEQCGYAPELDPCGPPNYDLQATPVIRIVKRRNTANKKERRYKEFSYLVIHKW